MKYWLIKSEPDAWSWDQQVAKGEEGEEWSGIRNYTARNNMREMKLGDRIFFYHSNKGLEVVGIVTLVDREEGAWENIEGAGQQLRAVLTRTEVVGN